MYVKYIFSAVNIFSLRTCIVLDFNCLHNKTWMNRISCNTMPSYSTKNLCRISFLFILIRRSQGYWLNRILGETIYLSWNQFWRLTSNLNIILRIKLYSSGATQYEMYRGHNSEIILFLAIYATKELWNRFHIIHYSILRHPKQHYHHKSHG